MVQNVKLNSNLKLEYRMHTNSKRDIIRLPYISGLNIYDDGLLYNGIYYPIYGCGEVINRCSDIDYFIENIDLFRLDHHIFGEDISICDIKDADLRDKLIETVRTLLINSKINNNTIKMEQDIELESEFFVVNMGSKIRIHGIKLFYKDKFYTDIYWKKNQEDPLFNIDQFKLMEYYTSGDSVMVNEIEDFELKEKLIDNIRTSLIDFLI